MKSTEFSRFVQAEDAVATYYENLGPAVVSCWKPSLKDLLRILFRRRVYLVVLGRRCPPACVSADPEEVGIDA